MSLIKCVECGKEMSDAAKKCPSCGYKEKKKISKKPLIIISSILLVAFVGLAFVFINSNNLTDIEKNAVKCVKDYKEKLKNPNSIKVNDIRWLDASMINSGDMAIYLDVSGENGFGGTSRSIVVYAIQNGKAVFGASTEIDKAENEEEVYAQMVLSMYSELKNDNNAKVSVDKVMKEVNKK